METRQNDPNGIPARSHCIVVSFTTTAAMTGYEASGQLRRLVMGSNLGVFACMSGPAGGEKNGERTAFRIAANIASLPDELIPEKLRPLKAQFIAETGHPGP